jgi:acetylornithine deacetylase/succinyl-diaminopimelate desuccinylase-like protein
VQTAEKGLAWMKLTANGTAGHGSMIHGDNAVTALAEALARVGRHQWPVQLPDSAKEFLQAASEALGAEFDPQDPASIIGKLGGMSKMIGATTQHTANPTGMRAGSKVNVIPQTGSAASSSTTTSPSRPRRTGPCGMPCRPRCWPRTRKAP